MPDSRIFSTEAQLHLIRKTLSTYIRLPFSETAIPGSTMEHVLGYVRKAEVLNTYDFVDVVSRADRIGWQVKSTQESTPVTWKRAKIPHRQELIAESRKTSAGLQALGDAIIRFCNEHAQASLTDYHLDEIGYARLVVHDNGSVTYFERLLCTRAAPELFHAEDYVWKWSEPKKVKTKEQLSALHGTHKASGTKAFAWHGQGENQLHFSGESAWWPKEGSHFVKFRLPSNREKLSLDEFLEIFAAHDKSI